MKYDVSESSAERAVRKKLAVRFNYDRMKRLQFDYETYRNLARVHESKGRQDLFAFSRDIVRQRLALRNEQEVAYHLSEFLQCGINRKRIAEIVSGNESPESGAESKIIAYRNILRYLGSDDCKITLSAEVLVRMLAELRRDSGFVWLTMGEGASAFGMLRSDFANYPGIEPGVFRMLENLCNSYFASKCGDRHDPVVLACAVMCDIICLNVFGEDTGLMALLVCAFCLFDQNIDFWRYSSPESRLLQFRDDFEKECRSMIKKWRSDSMEARSAEIGGILKIMAAVFAGTCRSYEEKLNQETKETSGKKKTPKEWVQEFIAHSGGTFKGVDCVRNCTYAGRSSVLAVLKELCEAGEIRRVGLGKNTVYKVARASAEAAEKPVRRRRQLAKK